MEFWRKRVRPCHERAGGRAMLSIRRIASRPASVALLPLPSGATGAYAQTDEIEAATIHPPVAARFQCSEHALGAEDHVPDALGADCVVVRREGGPGCAAPRARGPACGSGVPACGSHSQGGSLPRCSRGGVRNAG